MAKYSSKIEVENLALFEIEDEFDEQIDGWIESMSNYIDKFTGRTFSIDSDETEEKVYDGNGKDTLLVDDFVYLDSVTIDDEELDVLTYPNNTTPKFKIYSTTGFKKGKQNVKVTASWGYSEVPPEDIRFACTALVVGIIRSQIATEGDVTTERIGNYSISYTTKDRDSVQTALDILKRYRKYSI